MSLASLPRLSRLGFVRRRLEGARVRDCPRPGRAAECPRAPAVTLSGGNQQKLLFARALLGRAAACSSPTSRRGASTSAPSTRSTSCSWSSRRAGPAVLLISSEIEEVLGLSHRVLVMRAGRIVAELARRRR